MTAENDNNNNFEIITSIQCDAPGCGKWYDAMDFEPPLDINQIASQCEVWHCEQCIPYHGPSTFRRQRYGLRKRRRIDFKKLNDPGLHSENGGQHLHFLGESGANGVQDIDFWTMICHRKKNRSNFFKSGHDHDEGGCLMEHPLPGGEEFNADYVSKHGFNRPILFANSTPSQLGLRVPSLEDIKVVGDDKSSSSFSFANVATLVGTFRQVQVIDTATQLTTDCTLQEWIDYLETPPKDRRRTLNIITLEFSQTPLGKLVTEPKFARDVDFVNMHWPQSLEDIEAKGSGELFQSAEELDNLLDTLKKEQPHVSKYCLMSAAGSYTDFHVDFGGTSVWYHVYFGTKVFYFIEPTPANLKIYSDWATNSSGKNGNSRYIFLPDLIVSAGGEVYEVILQKGQTLYIASGWIHAVYTPEDSLVFGGNFLHRHSLDMELTIYKLERKMKIGSEFRYPNYQKLMWYVARDFLMECTKLMQQRQQKRLNENASIDGTSDLNQTQVLCQSYSPRILRGYNALATELVRWSTSKRKQIMDQFPENMNVASVSNDLKRMMKLCVAYLDTNERVPVSAR